jgi:hypothetical protein
MQACAQLDTTVFMNYLQRNCRPFLVSNIRGMDDQEARAKWCHDFGYALRANQADLNQHH